MLKRVCEPVFFLSKECLKFYNLLVLSVLKHISSINVHFPQHINIQARKKKKKNFKSIYFYFSFAVAIQLLSHVQLFATTWTAACQTSLFFTVFRSLLKLMSIESIMPSSHLILCCSFSSCLQSFPASGSFPVSWALCIR